MRWESSLWLVAIITIIIQTIIMMAIMRRGIMTCNAETVMVTGETDRLSGIGQKNILCVSIEKDRFILSFSFPYGFLVFLESQAKPLTITFKMRGRSLFLKCAHHHKSRHHRQS